MLKGDRGESAQDGEESAQGRERRERSRWRIKCSREREKRALKMENKVLKGERGESAQDGEESAQGGEREESALDGELGTALNRGEKECSGAIEKRVLRIERKGIVQSREER